MTVLKEPSVRPASQHRHSSTMAGSLPKARPHSHSLSVGSINPAHRVTRRKSMSTTAGSNVAAMAAVAKGIAGAPLAEPPQAHHNPARRPSKPATHFRGPALVHSHSMAASLPHHASPFGSYTAAHDGSALAALPESDSAAAAAVAAAKSRGRRASEGASRLAKGEAKRAGSDLRCEKCGKGYKHSSCLTKHLWEHTPEWQYTSKLLISKHQQVQLLEAASVLVAMNKTSDDSDDSPSPPASGDSDLRDGLSSTETTPPPHMDDDALGSYSSHSHFGHRSIKRYSANSSAYSHSYQSAVFSDNSNAHYRHWSNVSDRPTTSGTSVAGSYPDDPNTDQDMAAAVGLLSCSYGTPKSGAMHLPADVPPVPPLPAKFLDFSARALSANTTVTPQQSSMRNSYRYHESKDIDMDDDHFADEEDYRQSNSRSRSRADEDDDAFFGRMEE